jgi:oxygen-dependent protoporphyrinogen oxidase
MQAQVVVVGAGIAGLACATDLVAAGRDVLVLEAASRAGGAAETARGGGLIWERGPSTVRSTPDLERLAAGAGVALVPARRGAPCLVADGRIVALPPRPADVLRGRPLPLAALAGLALEPLRPRYVPGEHTVEQVVRERLGPAVAERIADALTLGVWGSPADAVGFEAAFPALAEGLARHGSFTRMALARLTQRGAPRAARAPIVSTPDGLDALPTALARKLGSRLHLECTAHALERRAAGGYALQTVHGVVEAEAVVLAAPASRARTLLGDDKASLLLAGARALPQAVAIFALDDAECAARWQAFGFLAPRREKLPLLGALFSSALFPGRAPLGTLLLSGFVAPGLRDATDAEISREVAPVLARLLGAARRPALVEVARHPQGIPLYDPGHPARLAALRGRLDALGGPILAGCAYDGVAFGAAASSGVAAARRLLARSRP